MSSSTEPRSGLNYGWSVGESGWAPGMDANLLSVGRFAYHLSVKDRDLTTPPGSPAAGDTYIPAPSSTGAWSTKDGQVTVWSGSAWVFGVPREGWRAWIEDEDLVATHDGTNWSGGQQPAGRFVRAMADANYTLGSGQAKSAILEATGALTALRDLVVPLTPRQWTVFANVTGGFGVRVIGATGTGITVADGKRAIVYSDGTNVVRVTADT